MEQTKDWYIQCTAENREILNGWRLERCEDRWKGDYSFIIGDWLTSCSNLDNSYYFGDSQEPVWTYKGYTKLTSVTEWLKTIGWYVDIREFGERNSGNPVIKYLNEMYHGVWAGDGIIYGVVYNAIINNREDLIKQRYPTALKLTKEEFYKYILQQEVKLDNTMEEIIGYKVKEKYIDAYRLIFGKAIISRSFMVTSAVYEKIKELDLLDIWCEPIYKQQEQIVSVGGKFDVTIKDKKVFYDGKDITEDWKQVYELLNK